MRPRCYSFFALFLGTTVLAKLLVAMLVFCTASAAAEALQMPVNKETSAAQPLPARGETMQAVIEQFGPPQRKHAPAGGDTPRHPPITRWDYPGFAVFFEQAHVVDAVVPGRPPPLYHADQLQAAQR